MLRGKQDWIVAIRYLHPKKKNPENDLIIYRQRDRSNLYMKRIFKIQEGETKKFSGLSYVP